MIQAKSVTRPEQTTTSEDQLTSSDFYKSVIKHNFKSFYSDIFGTVIKYWDSDIVFHCYGSILLNSGFEIKH